MKTICGMRLKQAGLRAKRAKCGFLFSEVMYMGYTLDKHGHRPKLYKTEAVLAAPEPKKREQTEKLSGHVTVLWQIPQQSVNRT